MHARMRGCLTGLLNESTERQKPEHSTIFRCKQTLLASGERNALSNNREPKCARLELIRRARLLRHRERHLAVRPHTARTETDFHHTEQLRIWHLLSTPYRIIDVFHHKSIEYTDSVLQMNIFSKSHKHQHKTDCSLSRLHKVLDINLLFIIFVDALARITWERIVCCTPNSKATKHKNMVKQKRQSSLLRGWPPWLIDKPSSETLNR